MQDYLIFIILKYKKILQKKFRILNDIKCKNKTIIYNYIIYFKNNNKDAIINYQYYNKIYLNTFDFVTLYC